MKKKITVLVCDFCSREGDDVSTRQLSDLAGGVGEIEADDTCWEKKTRALQAVARPSTRKRVSALRS